MATAENQPLDRSITLAVIQALKSAYHRAEILSVLGISADRLRVLEGGRGRLSVREMNHLEEATGYDYELWAMATARRRARSAEQHASLDDFYRIRGLREIQPANRRHSKAHPNLSEKRTRRTQAIA